MRRLSVTVAVVLMSSLGAGGAMAQSPSAGPETMTQRVEVAEAGYAVAFPADWVVETRDREVHASSLDEREGCQTTEEPLDEALGDPDAALDEFGAIYLSYYEPVLIEMSSFELPVGRAIRFVTEHADEGQFAASYLITDGLTLLGLLCHATEPPASDWWLGIAETLEFAPFEEEAVSGTEATGQRIEVPEAGIALIGGEAASGWSRVPKPAVMPAASRTCTVPAPAHRSATALRPLTKPCPSRSTC